MRNLFKIALAVFLLFTPLSPLWADDGAGAVFNQRISLDLRDIDVSEALKFLANKAGLNIISTKNVAGRISLTVANVPLKDIFDVMLRSNHLAYDKKGEIYNIMTEEEYKSLYGKNFSDMRQVKVFRLKYAIPDQAFNFLDALKSEIGRILVDPESGNVLIMDTPDHIAKMRKALAEFEKENIVEIITLKYAKAKDVEEALKTRLDLKKAGSIKADERSNAVIVQTLRERMQEVKRLINQLDRQTKQVLIDTKIVKIKLSDQLDTSLEWEGIFALARTYGMTYLGSYPFSSVQAASDVWRSRSATLNAVGGNVGSYPFSGTTTNYSASTKVVTGEAAHFGVVDDSKDYDVLLKFLQTLGTTKILSNPKLVAVNNQEAKIHVGERQAYVTTTTTTGQTTSTLAEEVNFVDVGIQLSITPNINDDGYVTMKVKPEISSVISTLITPTNNRIPIIDTSMAETTVMIKDGATLVIGGLRKEEKVNTSEQLPILGSIPLIGFFFKSSTSKVERTEHLILMTVHIITGDELNTGDERVFGHKPGKDYRDYQAMTPERASYDSDVPPEVRPKGLRDIEAEEKEIKFKIKDETDFKVRQEPGDLIKSELAAGPPPEMTPEAASEQAGAAATAGLPRAQEGYAAETEEVIEPTDELDFGIKEIGEETHEPDDGSGQ